MKMLFGLVSILLLSSVATMAQSQFNIQLVFSATTTPEQQAAFNAAAAKWQTIITGDIGNTVTIKKGTAICGQPPQAADVQVDDILIFAAVQPIDGVGKILGQAGPCGFDNAGKIRLGSMQFDSADVANLLAQGTFTATVLHEMGHVLGIGSDWARKGLVSPTAQGTPFSYLGAQGIQGQKDIGGSGKPVVEDIGGAGTARVHWKESVYQNELMTGFLSGNTQPLSKLTVEALKDLGYVVDVTKADDFVIPGGTAPAATKAPTTAGATKSPTKAPTKAPTNAAATAAPTTANANNQFNIQVMFLSTPTPDQKTAFDLAVAKWQSVITGDIGTTVRLPAGTNICGQTNAADILVDDILIFANIAPIDGVGKILGQAGPCGFDQTGRIRLGSMQFDSADVAQLQAAGTLNAVILHEMGHVLGIGTNWDNLKLITPATQAGPVSYLGANGIQGQKDIGGTGNPVVEDIGGAGTARGHWKEAVYQNELMTGFLSGNTQPMSLLTVESLIDLGYTVDVTKADAFTIPSAAGRRLRQLKNLELARFLQTTVNNWETGYPTDKITWNLPEEEKITEAGPDQWELDYPGEVALNLETSPKPDAAGSINVGAVAGGVVGALAVVGAAAFVVLRRQKSSQTPSNSHMAARNPMFNA